MRLPCSLRRTWRIGAADQAVEIVAVLRHSAMPIEQPVYTPIRPIRKGVFSLSMMRCASVCRRSRSVCGASNQNSVAAEAGEHRPGQAPRIASATSTSSRSPNIWP